MRNQIIFLMFFTLPLSLFGQPKVILSTDYSYWLFRNEALLRFDFSKYDISGGIRLKESLDVLTGVSYFQNYNPNSSNGRKTENLMVSFKLRYLFLKKYIVRPGVQLDLGGVVHSNLKNQIIRERLLLFETIPTTITTASPFRYSKFKNWGPVITPKVLVIIDLKYFNIMLGLEYTFLNYHVEDRGFYNIPTNPPVYRTIRVSDLGYTAGLIYKF